MPDVIDAANDLAQHHLDVALSRRPLPSQKPSAFECDECGDPIPEGRRKAVIGTQHCADCAGILEHKARLVYRG